MKIKNLSLQNKTLLAPMTNESDHAFRIRCRQGGAALVFTQKFHINALRNNLQKFHSDLEINPEEHPIAIQLIGNDPKILANVMELLEPYNYDGYDLNLGCPSPEAIRDGIGGALLKHPQEIRPLINAMVQATNKAVSAKIRIGFDNFSINALEVAKVIEEEGADFLTIHGRTVQAGYSGENNLDIIRSVTAQVNIPIVGNGDIVDGPSAKKILKYTKCELIMVGRAALKNPHIFLEINKYLGGKYRT
ncbi:MAG TPA: tRNA-dihydrouridine synthase family protein [Candidatus Deferrimicrobium sp.]|nr:tRNA-dihydrouridine synthase family protein [Candidatus Deferrimicrobium sp.]